MASAFSHIAIPIALNIALGHQSISPKLLILGMFLAIAPDLDAIAFLFEIPYSSQWGHRGFTHSVFFALGISLILLPTAKYFKAKHITFFFITFISLTSHPLLDALTNGGLGVAFWWPFSFERYFLPWPVIEVSPIRPAAFFTAKGLTILKSEFYFIWLPCFVVSAIFFFLRKRVVGWKAKLDY